MRFLCAAFLATLIIVASGESFGQSAIPVYLSSTVSENDNTGRVLVYEVKEAIRRSSGFRLIEDHKNWPYIRYSIVTLKGSGQTVVSHTFTFDDTNIPLNGALITAAVQFCGDTVVQRCARDLMGQLDSAVSELRLLAPDLWRRLR